ncbi:PLP-dependent aminotransferase family protein [Pseudomonas aeruginosa]|jgi:DNA-binding transcriptional MocR family regulator|uniref:aminotransferase-like domain-containing protein n=1 Tax=Pseudomonas aeruginosa TaxID=287 RepID=UPI00244AF9D2|nr:PLP-dependent aminotransferase family protein [Pseudomonas aeruginosa]MDG9818782.1 PLP-dependent aminotransferase family protein [Pseudomonas aeruginosa]MDG9933560.1 PLP-dependent aminotransferase family protein [Pseudomonas aeruginosa]MDH0526821.1 PLP-dependent aminotransferase family protein [Pseudomonas aeruginosa]MDH0532600.1 PLP-dependent aminotransferase family protein [Pseudomonas aeruginosa]HDQ4608398.1 PLP-dependent aminotransferase family protein [Pseudomonas aeruginosa]
MLTLDPTSGTPLVSQIVEGIVLAIQEQRLRPGSKLPSIRKFAQNHRVSLFTVAEAYDRLVARGCLNAVPNAGFYVRGHVTEDVSGEQAAPEFDFDAHLLLHKVFQPLGMELRPGIGLLPEDWLDSEGLLRGLRSLAREEPTQFGNYGQSKGNPRLRGKLADRLADAGVAATPEQVLLTSGASQALDLAVRYFVQRGDPVFVDEPGYTHLFLNLRLQGARLLGVPRSADGLDLERLEELAREHRPKVFFIQARLQSPTGTSLPLATCHRLLQLAEKYDFLIVENDIYADLDTSGQLLLANLDQLARVIYIGSLSKIIAPALRVGFIAAHPELIKELVPLKIVSGLTSSELTETLALDILLQGRQRKHVRQLRERLSEAHETVARRLEAAGLELFHEPRAGLFLWARHRAVADSTQLARQAKEAKILLFPGQLFMPDGRNVPWTRFNVAHSLDEQLYTFLARLNER